MGSNPISSTRGIHDLIVKSRKNIPRQEAFPVLETPLVVVCRPKIMESDIETQSCKTTKNNSRTKRNAPPVRPVRLTTHFFPNIPNPNCMSEFYSSAPA
ncbi:MAG: hypothetical protein LBR87_00345, partial [Synergistaceae bacterium]|nr:hypothetical protein [Synergistaceae bacterium]